MNIGKAIRTIRKAKGIRQGELAKICGLSQTTISSIESSKKTPSKKTIDTIVEQLDTSMVALVYLGLEESDIKPDKLEFYNLLKPSIDNLITQII